METEHQHQHQQEGGGAAATKAQKGMRESMQKKLSGARFRHLNEQLYTSSSTDAFTYVVVRCVGGIHRRLSTMHD